MDKKNEQNDNKPKKCFCARCFMPIEAGDMVDVDGQHFHKMCSSCCICRQIPTKIKMFYGNVFCEECFKTHVLNRFKGESPHMHSTSWWMQWAPGMHTHQCQSQDYDPKEKEDEEKKEKEPAAEKCACEEPQKRSICARCLQPVDDKVKVDIGGQCFHPQCARCYCCHQIPKDNVKIYYGQVFCEECFNRFVMARNLNTPAEHFRSWFEQMQNDMQFSEGMKNFLAGNDGKNASPMIFMMQGAHPPFCRCGNHPQNQAHEWQQANEARKSAVSQACPSIGGDSFGTCDLSFEHRTEVSDLHESRSRESANQENFNMTAAEKIAKLTKYLQHNYSEKRPKKWKNLIEVDKLSVSEKDHACEFPWISLQDPKVGKAKTCPDCLWQCGPILVNSEYFLMCCGENM